MASSVKLGERLERYVDELVEKGRYGSRSEVLREGVRLIHERESWLDMVNAKIELGLADVDDGRVHTPEEVRAEVRRRILSRA
ncbi:MAG: type II toxin-antitoxin system ParD family antitoxin [Sphingomonas taxi]|uniref:Type II toxin-antitoxin system ParD family antitoxin n=1 Tax=Sphingomonas taxi TaxID=1549858 RepID=A0A2W5PB44_9SPHN|nr:MAG: type II toxin-antitoxin system ParD family antitoxin [Sphingomonas taxi]